MPEAPFSDILGLPEFKALPHDKKIEFTERYWNQAAAEEPAPEQSPDTLPVDGFMGTKRAPSYHEQQYNDSVKLVETAERLKTATPLQSKFLQRDFEDSAASLSMREAEKAGTMTPDEISKFNDERNAGNVTRNAELQKTASLFTPEVEQRMQPAYDTLTKLAVEGNKFGNLGFSGKVNEVVSNILPGGQDHPIKEAAARYDKLRDSFAEDFHLKPAEVDDLLKHRMDLQKEDVSQDVAGTIHIKNAVLDKGADEISKAIQSSALPDNVKRTYTPEVVGERVNTFKLGIVDRVKNNSPELYKAMGLGENYQEPLDAQTKASFPNAPNPGTHLEQDYAKIQANIIDNRFDQAGEAIKGGLEGFAANAQTAAGSLHEGLSLSTYLPESIAGPQYRSPLKDRADVVKDRVKMRSDLTDLSHHILKDKLEIFGTDAATIGQGIYSGAESALVMAGTAGLGEVVMPAAKIAGMSGAAKWLAKGVTEAVDIAPMSVIYGIDDGEQVYKQAIDARKSPIEAAVLGIKSGVVETLVTMGASLFHLGGTEKFVSDLFKPAAKAAVKKSVSDTALKIAGKVAGKTALGIGGEELEENTITFLKEIKVQAQLNPQWTSNDLDKAIRDTATATLFASGPLSLGHGILEAAHSTPTHEQTDTELEAAANALHPNAPAATTTTTDATQEDIPTPANEAGPVAPPSTSDVAPREQMSKDEFVSLLDEELADPHTTEERRADLTGSVEEVAARTGVDLVEESTQWAKPTEKELAWAAAIDARYAEESKKKAEVPTTTKLENFSDPDTFYRVIRGDEAFQDILATGVVRTPATNQEATYNKRTQPDGKIDFGGRPTLFPSFSKGKVSESYARGEDNHYVIVSKDSSLQFSTRARHGKGTTVFPTDAAGNHLPSLDGKLVDVYRHTGNGKYELAYSKGKEVTPSSEQNQTIPENVPVQVPLVPTKATAPALTEPVVSNTEAAPAPEAQAQAPVNQEAVAKVVEEHKGVLTPETYQAVALGQQKTKVAAHLGDMEVTISSKVDGSEDTVEYSHKASDAISTSKNEKSAYDMLLDCLGRKKKH